ncbi:MBL fold metallo-hydrolase [Tunturiibacter gelidoferens]|uniref:Glyoxylase-like metal-dependent hydrolase (Beta-lactamase superfamily II) n=1 Tax=Tunturiibacter gelidiferens TaxID=3069689 RepID=A0A9X0U2X4_9BACT|nr:MBL fold metallo-hydrolase [Edaphobacter lichenicola]MBB5327816.1 glyoxylase-like metal-dependent hydrolase (beta-lactamase superfamily II) [Edaphobacter lichenicola]
MCSNHKQFTVTLGCAVTVLTAGMLMVTPTALGQMSQINNPDWSLRSPAIHWPTGHTPADADLFAHNELLIHSACSSVWPYLVDAQTWPDWYPNSHNVKLLNSSDGKLHQDTRFAWNTFGVHIESRVHEFAPSSRIGWFGYGTGMSAYHTFLLLPAPEGCRVVTEEVVTGSGAIEFRKTDPGAMHRGHDLWLSSLQNALSRSTSDATKPLSPKSQAPGFYRAMLGSFEVTALSDGTAPRHVDKILSKPDIAVSEYAADHEMEPIDLSINAYLINTGAHLVLIDTGAGELFGATSGLLVTNLEAAGYRPEQIDTILLTHIHADHSGGLSIGGFREFPKATVYVDERDLEFFVTRKDDSNESEARITSIKQSRATVGPYLEGKQISAIKQNGEIVSGITSRSQPGHTPGHTAFLVQSEGHGLLVWGDIIHSSEVQFEHPEVTVQYDVDAGQAAQTRSQQLQLVSDKGWLVGSEHISFPGLGHVRKVGSVYQWVPIPYSATVTELDPK